MQSVLEELKEVPWAAPLLAEIEKQGGITYANKSFLFEARVAYALAKAGLTAAQYEFPTGVKDTKVDFRLGTTPEWLVEVVSIGRSKGVEAASFEDGPFFGTILSSPTQGDTPAERKQSEEHEGLLVVQKIGEKVYDKHEPVKFPPVSPDQYHAVIVDMRGHLGGGDIHDWKQIAYGAEVVGEEYRKSWLTADDKAVPFMGIWHPDNPMRSAATARERLHMILFIGEEDYTDDGFLKNAWFAFNPHLVKDLAEAEKIASTFPLRAVFEKLHGMSP